MVTLVDPDCREPVGPVLGRLFRLTPAEIRLCKSLAKGADLNAFASAHDLSIGTVRSQLKAVLDKTGTHRQGELISMLARVSMPITEKAAAPTSHQLEMRPVPRKPGSR